MDFDGDFSFFDSFSNPSETDPFGSTTFNVADPLAFVSQGTGDDSMLQGNYGLQNSMYAQGVMQQPITQVQLPLPYDVIPPPIEQPTEQVKQDEEPLLNHLNSIREMFDSLIGPNVDREKMHPFGDLNFQSKFDEMDNHFKSMSNIIDQYSTAITAILPSDQLLLSKYLTSTKDFQKVESQISKTKSLIDQSLYIASKRYPNVVDNLIGFLQSLASEMQLMTDYSEDGKFDIIPVEGIITFGMQIAVNSRPPKVSIIFENSPEALDVPQLTHLLATGNYNAFSERLKELKQRDTLSIRFRKPVQDIEQRELQHLKSWLQKQTFAHQTTQDYYGDIIWYYFTRAYEFLRPKESSDNEEKRLMEEYAETNPPQRFSFRLGFETSPFFLAPQENNFNPDGMMIDQTNPYGQPPALDTIGDESGLHKVVRLIPAIPFVATSLRQLIAATLPDFVDKTSVKIKDNSPVYVEDLLVDNKAGKPLQETVNVFNEVHKYFHCDSKTPGLIISRIPFDNSEQLVTITKFLRQQLTFNELFLSCFAPPPAIAQTAETVSAKLANEKVLKSIEVRTEAPHLISVTCWHRYGLLKLNIRIKEDGEIETKLLTPNTNLSLSDSYIAKVLSTCHSIPLTMFNVFAKLQKI